MLDDGMVFTRLGYLVGDRHVDYPHVLEHELGHAADFESRKGPWRTTYTLRPMVASALGSYAGGPLGAKAAQRLESLDKEYRATRAAIKATKDKDAARNILLPAYGSYAGGAAGGITGLLLRNRIGRRVAGMMPLAGIVGGHGAARIYNALLGDKRKKQVKKRK